MHYTYADIEYSKDSEEDIAGKIQKDSALFILGLKEKYKLTQTATQGVIEGVTNLMQVRMIINFEYIHDISNFADMFVMHAQASYSKAVIKWSLRH